MVERRKYGCADHAAHHTLKENGGEWIRGSAAAMLRTAPDPLIITRPDLARNLPVKMLFATSVSTPGRVGFTTNNNCIIVKQIIVFQ